MRFPAMYQLCIVRSRGVTAAALVLGTSSVRSEGSNPSETI